MKINPFKQMMFMKAMAPVAISAGLILTTVIVAVVVVNMSERSALYMEGAAKSMPMLRNDALKGLGDLYIKLNRDFEKEMKDYELSYANRKNKRGDKIYYGINGRENVDELVNDDYVNGVNISYVKGGATNRANGESNYTDMLAFLSTALGSDIDKYDETKLKEVFTKLFKLTHTYSGTSTELYPCTHGCAWCKYYCGDFMVQGTVNGDTVGFYQCDEYMGQSGKYGLMYDPFLMSVESAYPELVDKENDTRTMVTTTQSKHTNPIEHRRVVCDGGKSSTELFQIAEMDGICEVCSGGNTTFRSTTRKFAGCEPLFDCYHADDYEITKTEEGETYVVYSCPHGIGHEIPTDCSDFSDDYDYCSHEECGSS